MADLMSDDSGNMARRIQRKAMAGRPLSAEEQAWLESRMPDKERGSRALTATTASALDPFNIPSAAVGLLSPETRDKWRDVQASEGLGPQILGGAVGGLGALSQVGRIPQMLPRVAAAMGMGAGSDVIDRAAGERGAIGPQTIAKSVTAPIGMAPARVTTPLVAGGAAAAMGLVDPASAAELTEKQKRALEMKKQEGSNTAEIEIAKERQRAEIARQAEEDRLRREAAAEVQRLAREAGVKAAEDKRALDQVKVGEARAARDEILSNDRRPFDQLELPGGYKVGPYLQAAMPFAPALLGALTGGKFGSIGAAGDKSTLAAARKTIDEGLTAASPAVKFEAAQAAKDLMGPYAQGVPLNQIAKSAALPAAIGGIEGAAVSNLPQFYNSYLPEKNQRRLAMQAYLDRLPPDSPERPQVQALINGMPETTEARDLAMQHFKNGDWAPRAIQGGAEGAVVAGGGYLGRRLIPFKGGIGETMANNARLQGQVAADISATAERMVARNAMDADYAQKSLDALRRQADADVQSARIKTDRDQSVKYFSGDSYRGNVDQDLAATQTRAADLMSPQPVPMPSAPVPASPPPAAVSSSPALPPPSQVPMPIIPGPANSASAVPAELTGSSGSSKVPRLGPWQQTWSDPARNIVETQVAAGGSIGPTGITAEHLRKLIGQDLPKGTKLPSESLVSERLGRLRLAVGQNPTLEQLQRLYAMDPHRAVFGLPLAAYVGSQMMPTQSGDLMGPSY